MQASPAHDFLAFGATLNQYQDAAVSFAIYPKDAAITYPALGLIGESGEVEEKLTLLMAAGRIAEKLKKTIRDGRDLDRQALAKELGDVQWYIACLARDIGYTLQEVAEMNITKLIDRKARGVVKGDGDDR